MDAVDILKTCLRRWYVMLPILLGAAGVSYQLLQAQETTYTAAASYGLVQPDLAAIGAENESQRYPLGPEGSALVGAALEAQLNSRETQEQLGSDKTRGWGPGEVENDSSYSVKIPQFETTYEVRAWGTDEKAVRAVVNRVIEAAPGIADDLQDRAGAPSAGRYQPFVLAPTQVAVLPSTAGKKLVVAVMGVGVLVGAAWSIVVDVALRRRARSRESSPPGEPDPLGGPDPLSGPDPARLPVAAPVSASPPAPSNGPVPVRRSVPSKKPTSSKRIPAARAGQQKKKARQRELSGGPSSLRR